MFNFKADYLSIETTSLNDGNIYRIGLLISIQRYIDLMNNFEYVSNRIYKILYMIHLKKAYKMMFIRFKTRYDSIRESLKKNNTQLNSADDKTKN